MERILSARAQRKLSRRAPLPVDAGRSIAVKRDVHEFEVDVDAAAFARAFRDVMTDPEGRFGLIRVKRPAERMGREFAVGERFQGCFSLEAAFTGWAARGRWPALAALVEPLLSSAPLRALVTWLEDQLLSDYAEIEELVLEPDPERGEQYLLRYRYLEGTPIAGSSTFSIEPAGPGRCRVRQVFEFQEVNAVALGTFERFGLKFHDQVVHMQMAKAAARAGAGAPRGTIPAGYAAL